MHTATQTTAMFKALWILMICAFLDGCGYSQMVADQLKSQADDIGFHRQIKFKTDEPYKNSVLTGFISGNIKNDAKIAIVAYEHGSSTEKDVRTLQFKDYTTISGTGNYTLFLYSGSYQLCVYVDSDGDGDIKATELAAFYGKPDMIHLEKNQVIDHLDFDLNGTSEKLDTLPVDFAIDPTHTEPFNTLDRHATVSLQDQVFANETAEQGLWTPDDFSRKIGFNIYALKPYTPDLVPILFIHGVAGSPANWATIAKNIDHTRFQAWFLYYPSGLRLDPMAALLESRLNSLYNLYGFKELIITAHSMGGLVARGYLTRYAKTPFPAFTIESYISFSTPYDGHELAGLGAESRFPSVPCWKDVATGSDYINQMYSRKLPDGLTFYLLFGYTVKDDFLEDLLLGGESDGIITVRSQLASRARAEATLIKGFNETHTGILKSDTVIKYYNHILNDRHQLEELSGSPSAEGNLFLDVPPDTQVEILNAKEPYRPGIGLKPGQYLVEIKAYGYKTLKKWIGVEAETKKHVKIELQKLESEPNSASEKYLTILASDDLRQKKWALRQIYSTRPEAMAVYAAVENELLKKYAIKTNDRNHIDTLCWMCKVLGISGEKQYLSTLEMVAGDTKNAKLQRYAMKSLLYLEQNNREHGK